MIKPGSVNKKLQLKSCSGKKPLLNCMPVWASVCMVAGAIASGCGSANNTPPIKPPKIIPAAKKILQLCLRHSYFKNGTLPGKQAAHTCRITEDTPKSL